MEMVVCGIPPFNSSSPKYSMGYWFLLVIFFLIKYFIKYPFSRGTKVAYRAKTHIFCTRKVYGWNFVY